MNPSQTSWLIPAESHRLHQEACQLANAGDYLKARAIYRQLETQTLPPDFKRLIRNNQAALAVLDGDMGFAVKVFEQLSLDAPDWRVVHENLKFLRQDRAVGAIPKVSSSTPSKSRIVLISFLFNWPSPAGGIVHTVELAQFLARAGYEVTLLHPQYDPWQIGQVRDCPVPVETLPFSDREWNSVGIKQRFRQEVGRIAPEAVIVTDCWNFKPHLVEALRGHRVFLRMQAHECLCPLNNLRIQPHPGGGMRQCPVHQLAAREECLGCLDRHAGFSGSLHRRERLLSEVESPGYETLLKRSFKDAEAVLVLNPLIAEVLRPYCRRVETITWGMDPGRFPEPVPRPRTKPLRILFAGLVNEPIKGFETLRLAGRRLWEQRQDWELVVTGEPMPEAEPFLRFAGWKSQAELPALYREADIVAVPTWVQDGLSRTAVEGMASGRAVVASRLGAMPFLIAEGLSGLLCEAGNAGDWAQALGRLLDDADLREELGRNGRRVFCERFLWERVIERDYRPLLSPQLVARKE